MKQLGEAASTTGASRSILDVDFFNQTITEYARKLEDTRQELTKVIIGQNRLIEDVLTTMVAGGHALLEGVPGTGKTLLCSSLGKVTGLDSKRIQFTPDLMAGDITGSDIFDENERKLKFVPGPIFTQVLLADEINRAPQQTQAALLQAMQEREVSTITEGTLNLSPLFFVMATENPIDQEGTYPLPEAQVDRFLMKTIVTYPERKSEMEIGRMTTGTSVDLCDLYNMMTSGVDIVAAPDKDKESSLRQIISPNELFFAQKLARGILVPDGMWNLIVDMTRSLRPADDEDISKLDKDELQSIVNRNIEFGPGTRAIQSLALCAKTRALMEGMPAVNRKHIYDIAEQVLNHRTLIYYGSKKKGIKFPGILEKAKDKVTQDLQLQ